MRLGIFMSARLLGKLDGRMGRISQGWAGDGLERANANKKGHKLRFSQVSLPEIACLDLPSRSGYCLATGERHEKT